jgi:hypothetical protein
VATEAGQLLRVAAPDERGTIVLRGTPKRLRGEVDVANDGSTAVIALPTATAADRSDVMHFTNPAGAIVAPGTARRVRLHASLDPTTAPGSFAVELDVGGQTVAAIVEVIEQVDLSLSPSSVVVDGVTGAAGAASVLATNARNVPLAISQVGPVPLELDGERATFLDRLLGRETLVAAPATVVNVHVHTADDTEDEEEEEEPPVVTGTLTPPIELQPGETRRLEWAFEITGELEPGRRYRAIAPCYTADLEIVAVPHQSGPAVIPPPAVSAAGTPAKKTAAKKSPAKKTAAARKTPAKKSSAGTKRAGATKRATSKTRPAARARRHTATEENR